MELSTRPADRRGFSLIELLVVIFIIVVIVAITIPALAIARKAARKSETKTQLGGLNQAVVQFHNDNRRAPGYFPPRELGTWVNASRGFTAMQNLLLDLSGGVLENQATPLGTTVVDVGPAAANTVRIDHALIGAVTPGKNIYFTINRKALVLQDGVAGGEREGIPEHVYPELVDPFGTPILAWAIDTTAIQPIRVTTDFARVESGPSAAPTPARFYLASNSAFLSNGRFIGKRRISQTALSMVGASEWGGGIPNAARSLTGLVGSPNSPLNLTTPAGAATTMLDILPSAPRGSVVFHSAGEDGAFLPKRQGPGVKDAGVAQCYDGTTAILHYGFNFSASGTTRLANSTDMVQVFNDIIQHSGL